MASTRETGPAGAAPGPCGPPGPSGPGGVPASPGAPLSLRCWSPGGRASLSLFLPSPLAFAPGGTFAVGLACAGAAGLSAAAGSWVWATVDQLASAKTDAIPRLVACPETLLILLINKPPGGRA